MYVCDHLNQLCVCVCVYHYVCGRCEGKWLMKLNLEPSPQILESARAAIFKNQQLVPRLFQLHFCIS